MKYHTLDVSSITFYITHINGFTSEINENLSFQELHPRKDVSHYLRATFIAIQALNT